MLALLLSMALAGPDLRVDPHVQAMVGAAEAELERAMEMRLPDQPAPYYVSYEILDGQVTTASAQGGALSSASTGPYRTARVQVRVGDYAFDNTRFDGSFGTREGTAQRGLPDDPNPIALRRELWLATDQAYKGATEQLSAKLAAREGRVEPDEPVPSYERREGVQTPVLAAPSVDGDATEARVKALSAAIDGIPGLESAEAMSRDWAGRRLVVTSEGTRAWLPTGYSVVRVEGIARTEDGIRLRDCRWWVARTPDQLPSLDEMVADVEEMASLLAQAAEAPIEDDYLGPVLFEQAAAVELFRQLLVPEVSGTPPSEMAPDPFMDTPSAPPTARIGRRLLPEGWEVWDDPTADPSAAGYYTRDFEVVAPRRVDLVENGVLRDVLMSRIPRGDVSGSTGHGRGLGIDDRSAMPGSVWVEPARSVSEKKLRKRALTLARQAGLDYVLVVRRVEPPALAEDYEVAFTGEGPLAGLTRPLEVVRLYRDGREELVRPTLAFLGVDRRVLRDIAAAGTPGAAVGVLDAPPGPRRFSLGTVGGLPASWSVPPVVVTELELRQVGGGQPRAIPRPQ